MTLDHDARRAWQWIGDNAVTENVRRQVVRLKSSPPIVQKLYVGKKIDIVGGVYDLATGKIALV